MFLRASTRKKDGKSHRYWRLVENVRVGLCSAKIASGG
jgi:hypothetical protein